MIANSIRGRGPAATLGAVRRDLQRQLEAQTPQFSSSDSHIPNSKSHWSGVRARGACSLECLAQLLARVHELLVGAGRRPLRCTRQQGRSLFAVP